VNIHRYL